MCSHKNSYLCPMQLKFSIEEKEEVRRLQRNAVGTPGYVRLTCVLMFDNGRNSEPFLFHLVTMPALLTSPSSSSLGIAQASLTLLSFKRQSFHLKETSAA